MTRLCAQNFSQTAQRYVPFRGSSFEKLFSKEIASQKKGSPLRPQQRLVVHMQDILRKYSDLGSLVFKTCLGASAGAISCRLDNRNENIIYSEKNSG